MLHVMSRELTRHSSATIPPPHERRKPLTIERLILAIPRCLHQCTAGCRDCQTKQRPPRENTALRSHPKAIGAGSAGVPPSHHGGVFGRFPTFGAPQPTITSFGYNELKRGQPPTRMNNFSDSRVISPTRRRVQALVRRQRSLPTQIDSPVPLML